GPVESTNARKHPSTGSGQAPAVSDVEPWFRGQTVLAAAVVAVVAVAAVVSLPPWDPQLLSSGAYKYAPYIGAADLDVGLRAGTLEFYKEGAAATVSVRRLAGVRALSIDGKVDASNGGGLLNERVLGVPPVPPAV